MLFSIFLNDLSQVFLCQYLQLFWHECCCGTAVASTTISIRTTTTVTDTFLLERFISCSITLQI